MELSTFTHIPADEYDGPKLISRRSVYMERLLQIVFNPILKKMKKTVIIIWKR